MQVVHNDVALLVLLEANGTAALALRRLQEERGSRVRLRNSIQPDIALDYLDQ